MRYIHIWLLIIFGFFCGLLSGCKTQVTGGQSQQVSKSEVSTGGSVIGQWTVYHLFMRNGGVEIIASKSIKAAENPDTNTKLESTSTTQPSVETDTGQTPEIGAAKPGTLGSLSLKAVESNAKQQWGLVLLFVGLGIAAWFLAGQKLLAIGCGVCAILTALAPAVMIWVAIAVGGLIIYLSWNSLKQLVTGTQAALDSVEPAQAAELKQIMSTKHDRSTKNIVASIKAHFV